MLIWHYITVNQTIPFPKLFLAHTPHCMCFFVSEPTFADSYSFSISLFSESVSLFIPIITHISALSSALERYCSYFFVWCNSLSQRNIKNYIEGNEQGELKFNFQNVWFGIIWIWQYKQGIGIFRNYEPIYFLQFYMLLFLLCTTIYYCIFSYF